jgi:plastocyanin
MQEPQGGGPERPGIIFKTWQIFVFSLIPLALVFIGVISGSIHGSDSDKEAFPTAAPPPPPPPQGSPGPGGATTLQIQAANLTFNPRSLTAPPETQVTVRMDNRDAGVLHNFAVYRTNQATQQIFVGPLHTGPGTIDYSFRTPAPGTYFFRCDVHPDTMTGTFNVR